MFKIVLFFYTEAEICLIRKPCSIVNELLFLYAQNWINSIITEMSETNGLAKFTEQNTV